MIKIWAKVIKQQKIVSQTVYENNEQFNDSHFYLYLMDICKELDLETPIILKKHLSNFKEFRSIKFLKEDFLENVDYDFLLLEDISI